MRRTLIALLLFLPTLNSCDSGFKDERDELAYLSNLSNPTPQQWRRRQELESEVQRQDEEARLEIERRETQERKRREIEWSNPANVAARRQAEISARMREGKSKEDGGSLRGALDEYQVVIEKYPDSPEARVASEAIERIDARMQEAKIAAEIADHMKNARMFEVQFKEARLAIPQYQEVIRKYPQRPEAKAARAEIVRLGGDPDAPR